MNHFFEVKLKKTVKTHHVESETLLQLSKIISAVVKIQ